MRGGALAGKINHGIAVAARHTGDFVEIYRPTRSCDPVNLDQRIAVTPARMFPGDGLVARAARFGTAVWTGFFDRCDVMVGDYIVGQDGVFFVSSLEPFAPALCIQTNRTVTISRTPEPTGPGDSMYSGVRRSVANELFRNWPVSLTMTSELRPNRVGLPGGGAGSITMMLLPVLPEGLSLPMASDLVMDDLGTGYLIEAIEQTSLGWRAVLKLTMG